MAVTSLMDAYLTVSCVVIGEEFQHQSIESFKAGNCAKVKVQIPATATDEIVNLAPVDGAVVKAIIIKASKYDDGTGKLVYTLQNLTTEYKLDSPHVLRGDMIDKLLTQDPFLVKFDNDYTETIDIEILCIYDSGTQATYVP